MANEFSGHAAGINTYKLFEDLIDDVIFSFKQLEENKESQTLRRNAVRAVFGFVEGVCSIILYEVHRQQKRNKMDQIEIHFSKNEQKVLQGKETDLTKRIKKSFLLYSRSHGFIFDLDLKGDGYVFFGEGKQVRNRLIHPKRYADIEISENAMAVVSGSYIWVKTEFIRLIREMIDHNLSQLPEVDLEQFRKILKC